MKKRESEGERGDEADGERVGGVKEEERAREVKKDREQVLLKYQTCS